MPKSLLLSEDKVLLHAFGGAEAYVRLPGGRVTVKVPECLVPPLRAPVSEVLRKVTQEKSAGKLSRFVLNLDGKKQPLSITVEPVREGRSGPLQYLVLFEPLDVKENDTPIACMEEPSDYAKEQIKLLENELGDSQENLQSVIEELELSNEELQAGNEELVASNEELQSTNELSKLAMIVSQSEDAIIALSFDGEVESWNQGAETLFGYSPEEVVGRRLYDLIAPSEVERLQRAIEKGESTRAENFEFTRSDGGRISLEIFLQPILSGDSIERIVISILDNTARVRAEQEREWLSKVVNSSDDLIGSCDPDGQTWFMNPGGLALWGLPKDADVKGWDMSERVDYEATIRACEDESRKITSKFSAVIESIPDLHFMVGTNSQVEFCSPNTRTFFTTIGGEHTILSSLRNRIQSVLETGCPYRPLDYLGVIEVKVGNASRCLLPRIQPNYISLLIHNQLRKQ